MEVKEYESIRNALRTSKDVDRLISEGYDHRMINTMYRQKVNRMVKKRYHSIKRRSSNMLRDWKNGESFCQIADRLEFPPILIAMMIFQEYGTSKKNFWGYVRDPSLLDSPETARELAEADARDLVYSPAATKHSAELGKWGEGLLWNWLDSQGIDYMTEEDERRRSGSKGGKTPDCLLAEPLSYEGHEIYWIESKASFGDGPELRYNSRNQLIPYTEIFGPGIVVYWTGHVDGLKCPENVYLEDMGLLEKKLKPLDKSDRARD